MQSSEKDYQELCSFFYHFYELYKQIIYRELQRLYHPPDGNH